MNDIYKDVLRFADISEGRFRSLYSLTLSELCAEFGEEYVIDAQTALDRKSDGKADGKSDGRAYCKACGKANRKNDGTSDNFNGIGRFDGVCTECFPEYRSAVVNNILYLDNTEKSVLKELSISQRADAYASVWRRKFGGKSAKPHAWH